MTLQWTPRPETNIVAGISGHQSGELHKGREKKAHNIKERIPNAESSHHQRKNKYTSPIKDQTAFKMVSLATKNFTHLNTHCEQIWCKVLYLHNILTPPSKEDVMGSRLGRWCKFYKVKGHHIKDYYQLTKEIERLI